MKQIEDAAIIDGAVVLDDLILTRYDASQINAGNVRGVPGVKGDTGVGGILVVTSTTRHANPTEGMTIYETDTDQLWTYNGATWTWPKNVAGGILGFSSTTLDQTGITTEVDLTNLSVTVTAVGGRRIKVLYQVMISRSVLDGYSTLIVKAGTIPQAYIQVVPGLVNIGTLVSGFAYLLPTAGAHTYKLSLERSTGTGTTQTRASGFRASIHVEDIGGV
jgi:hypothetical protein